MLFFANFAKNSDRTKKTLIFRFGKISVLLSGRYFLQSWLFGHLVQTWIFIEDEDEEEEECEAEEGEEEKRCEDEEDMKFQVSAKCLEAFLTERHCPDKTETKLCPPGPN